MDGRLDWCGDARINTTLSIPTYHCALLKVDFYANLSPGMQPRQPLCTTTAAANANADAAAAAKGAETREDVDAAAVLIFASPHFDKDKLADALVQNSEALMPNVAWSCSEQSAEKFPGASGQSMPHSVCWM